MKKLLVILAVTGVVYGINPEQAFNNLLDSVYSGDAEGFQNCISTESNGMIDMMLMMVKFQPEDAVEQISTELGVEITAEELSEWTSSDLIETVLLSPGFQEQLPPRENISVSGFEINGDSSMVCFNITDLPQPFELLMVKDGNTWKLDQSVIQEEI